MYPGLAGHVAYWSGKAYLVRHNSSYISGIPGGGMARRRDDPKEAALREARCLNPRPEAVADQAATAVDAGGLAALVPARPGPRRAHKLTTEVVAFARQARAADPSLRSADL